MRNDPDPVPGQGTQMAHGEDDLVRLREWGSDRAYVLPGAGRDVRLGRGEPRGAFRLGDHTLPNACALLSYTEGAWSARALDGAGSFDLDGASCSRALLAPGVELTIDGTTLVVESRRSIALRSFMARLLGWSADKRSIIDLALRSIRLAAMRRLPLVLCGPGDLVLIALAIHRQTLGDERPFVVCDPRRREGEADARVAANVGTGAAAMQRAGGGSLCVWSRRLPPDFKDVRAELRDPRARVQLVVCVESWRHAKLYYIDPVMVPPLQSRSDEITRIIDEYTEEATFALSATVTLSSADREWILRHSASSVPEIEKGTRRLLAFRMCDDNVTAAARMLGMAPISLARWIGRRALPDRR